MTPGRPLRIGIVAGEISGDILGGGLLKALKARFPDCHIEGIGGDLMIAEGCTSFFPLQRLAVMGFVEPLKRLPELWRIRRALYQHFKKNPPDVFIGIDAPDFNLGLEKKLKAHGVKTVHYVSPSVWAWRRRRIHHIKKSVDLMLTLFPFESEFYDQHHLKNCFVGHPLADDIPLNTDTAKAQAALGLSPSNRYLTVLPGSRDSEIRLTGSVLIRAAARSWRHATNLHVIIPIVRDEQHVIVKTLLKKQAPDLPVTLLKQQSRVAITASDMVIATSGTVTLEAMLIGKPMVVAYCMGPWTYRLARCLVKTPYIALPNLLAGKPLVPEFIQAQATPEAIAEKVLAYYHHPESCQAMLDEFREIQARLRLSASDKAADAIGELMKGY